MENTEVVMFDFDGNDVRTLMINNEPYFVARDVAEVLGYVKPENAIRRHCDEALKRGVTDTVGRKRLTSIINESDVYSLIFGSKLDSAKLFKKWVTHEVLPSIRKHGVYATEQTLEDMLSNPDTMIKTLQALKGEQDARKLAENKVCELEAIIEDNEEKIEFHDAVIASSETKSIRDVSVLLGHKGYGRNNLLELLRNKKILDWRGIPYQKYVDCGYFKGSEDYNVHISPRVFQKGIKFIDRLIKNNM